MTKTTERELRLVLTWTDTSCGITHALIRRHPKVHATLLACTGEYIPGWGLLADNFRNLPVDCILCLGHT